MGMITCGPSGLPVPSGTEFSDVLDFPGTSLTPEDRIVITEIVVWDDGHAITGIQTTWSRVAFNGTLTGNLAGNLQGVASGSQTVIAIPLGVRLIGLSGSYAQEYLLSSLTTEAWFIYQLVFTLSDGRVLTVGKDPYNAGDVNTMFQFSYQLVERTFFLAQIFAFFGSTYNDGSINRLTSIGVHFFRLYL